MFSNDKQDQGCTDCGETDESHVATISVLPSIREGKSTCCHKCGHKHVKGTSHPTPYLTGEKNCKNK